LGPERRPFCRSFALGDLAGTESLSAPVSLAYFNCGHLSGPKHGWPSLLWTMCPGTSSPLWPRKVGDNGFHQHIARTGCGAKSSRLGRPRFWPRQALPVPTLNVPVVKDTKGFILSRASSLDGRHCLISSRARRVFRKKNRVRVRAQNDGVSRPLLTFLPGDLRNRASFPGLVSQA